MSDAGGIGADRLRSFVERIERLEEEKAALTADIREVYAEAKGEGFDTKVMRQVVRLRKMDSGDRQEQEAILDLYKQALGMLDGTPLGNAAMKAAQRLVDSVAKSDGDSVSITGPDGNGVKIKNEDGKKKVETVSRGAMA